MEEGTLLLLLQKHSPVRSQTSRRFQDRTWENMPQSGPPPPPGAARKGPRGLRVLRGWSSQKTVSSVPPPPLPNILAAK